MIPRGPATERLYDALTVHGHRITHQGGTWRTTCPAHGGDNATALSFRDGDQGVILKCWTRDCTAASIAEAVGLRPGDLFDDRRGATYDYGPRPDGKRFTVHRKLTATGKTFTAKNAPTAPELRPLRWFGPCEPGQMVVLAEGEKTADAIEQLAKDAGYTTYCVATWPGGSGQVEYADLSPLAGREVVIAPDNDEAGEKVLGVLLRRLHEVGANVTYVWRTPAEFDGHEGLNDAADLALAGGTLADLVRDDEAVSTAQEPRPGSGEPGTGWDEIPVLDLAHALAAGMVDEITPEILTRSDGRSLFYAGRVNGVHGDSGAGKSWVALLATAQTIAAGEHVIYVDLEDGPKGVLSRLLALGIAADDLGARFHYFAPEIAFRGHADGFLTQVASLRPALVVIDSTGESMALEGLSSMGDDEVALWFRSLPRPIAKLGPAVVVLDHMPKAPGSDLWPIGSHRKRAAIDGAQYLQELGVPFSRGQAGMARLICAKDRNGAYALREKVAELIVTPEDGRVRLELRAPEQSTGDSWKPTAIMAKITAALESAPGLTYNAILDAVKGKREYVRAAVDELIAEGIVRAEPGPRRSTLHYLATDPQPETLLDPDNDRGLIPIPREGIGGSVTSPIPGISGGSVGISDDEAVNA